MLRATLTMMVVFTIAITAQALCTGRIGGAVFMLELTPWLRWVVGSLLLAASGTGLYGLYRQ